MFKATSKILEKEVNGIVSNFTSTISKLTASATKATQEENGVKTYTCKVCQHTKTEEIEVTGLSRSEWNKAFEISVFENFTYREKSSTKDSGVTIESDVE